MLDRESTFADPEIVELLKKRFIAVAIDQAYQRRQQDTEGEFYRKLAQQGPRGDFKKTTQGFYIGTAGGRLLAYNNNRGPERIRQLLRTALAEYRPEQVEALDASKPDLRYSPKPPEGGLVLRVNAKVLGGYAPTDNPWQKLFQQALSRDNFWTTADEHRELVAGRIPDSFAQRLARFHLVDSTRGEPPMWKESEIQSITLTLKDGELKGRVHLETAAGDRGFKCELLGRVRVDDKRVTRFDVVAKGEFWGEGRYTRGAPKGKFPLAVALRLADGKDLADGIPPQGSRGWVRGYIR